MSSIKRNCEYGSSDVRGRKANPMNFEFQLTLEEEQVNNIALNLKCLEATTFQEFVTARFEQLKAEVPGYSYRKFSELGGFGSPSYLKLVMLGQRTVAPKSFRRFMLGLLVTPNIESAIALKVFLNDSNGRITRELTGEVVTQEVA